MEKSTVRKLLRELRARHDYARHSGGEYHYKDANSRHGIASNGIWLLACYDEQADQLLHEYEKEA